LRNEEETEERNILADFLGGKKAERDIIIPKWR
jgi:hypothetical protein